MKNRFGVVILACTMTVLMAGCYTQNFIAGAVDKPAKMSGAAAEKQQFTVIKSFSVTDRSGWFIFGLVPVGHTDLNEIINQEVKAAGGDAVINLRIETKYDFVDVLIGILVGGLYNSRVSMIQGDIIKYQ